MTNLNGIQYNCDGSPYATFLPREEDPDKGISYETEVFEPILEGTATSAGSIENKDFSVYPNPSKGQFQLSFGAQLPLQYEVLTLSGKVLESGTPTSASVQLDLQQVPAGVYLLKVRYADGQHMERINIQ